jgi:hypothetical protein
MRAHIVRSRGQVAVHSRTPAVAARMPPAVMLVINLRIGAAADCCCGNSSSLLLPDSVKPAVQRGVQNSRGLVPPEAERVRARRPELDGTTRLIETRGTGHGRTAEREVASGEMYRKTKITHGPSAELGIGPPRAAWRGAVVHPSGGPSAPGRRCWRLGRKRPSPFFQTRGPLRYAPTRIWRA